MVIVQKSQSPQEEIKAFKQEPPYYFQPFKKDLAKNSYSADLDDFNCEC